MIDKMELIKIYKYLDLKYSPLISYLSISPPDELLNMLELISNKNGCIREFHGFEFKDINTITFYDFSSDIEKSCNLSLTELLNIIEPQADDYCKLNPSNKEIIKAYLLKIKTP